MPHTPGSGGSPDRRCEQGTGRGWGRETGGKATAGAAGPRCCGGSLGASAELSPGLSSTQGHLEYLKDMLTQPASTSHRRSGCSLDGVNRLVFSARCGLGGARPLAEAVGQVGSAGLGVTAAGPEECGQGPSVTVPRRQA